jgi:hypothetical protein
MLGPLRGVLIRSTRLSLPKTYTQTECIAVDQNLLGATKPLAPTDRSALLVPASPRIEIVTVPLYRKAPCIDLHQFGETRTDFFSVRNVQKRSRVRALRGKARACLRSSAVFQPAIRVSDLDAMRDLAKSLAISLRLRRSS